jgi:hypothetical protein
MPLLRRKSVNPKLIRLRNGVGREYFLVDYDGWDCKMAFNCPTCGNRSKKGDIVFRGSYLTERDSFHIRHRLYCSEKCVQKTFKSK